MDVEERDGYEEGRKKKLSQHQDHGLPVLLAFRKFPDRRGEGK